MNYKQNFAVGHRWLEFDKWCYCSKKVRNIVMFNLSEHVYRTNETVKQFRMMKYRLDFSENLDIFKRLKVTESILKELE